MPNNRFAVLDSWRGICALLVATFHFPAISHLLYADFIRHSWIFVDFFFVLSGFVISHAYGRQLATAGNLADFAVRRFARVWPLHIAMLLLFIALELIKLRIMQGGFTAERQPFSGQTSLIALAYNLALLQALYVFPELSWNFPSWSISAEYWTYIVFGIVMLACTRGRKGDNRRADILLALLFALLPLVLGYVRGGYFDFTQSAFLRCLYGFIGGHFAYRAFVRTKGLGASSTGIECATILMIVTFVIYSDTGGATFLAPFIFGSAIFVFAHEAGRASRILRSRPLLWLGMLSYSIYMTHWFIFQCMLKAVMLVDRRFGLHILVQVPDEQTLFLNTNILLDFHHRWAGDLAILLFLGAVCAFSWCTYHVIERPGQRFLLGLAKHAGMRRKRTETEPAPL